MVKKALFLDRDGIINMDSGYVSKIEDFIFMDGIFSLCKKAVLKDYLLIVVTNQAGIARGYYTEEDFFLLNEWMQSQFIKQNVTINKVYFCPFHPDGVIKEYKSDSECRKPNPGMFLTAKKDFGIDMRRSVLLGDKESDVIAGKNSGVGLNVLLKSKYTLNQNTSEADYIIDSITDMEQLL